MFGFWMMCEVVIWRIYVDEACTMLKTKCVDEFLFGVIINAVRSKNIQPKTSNVVVIDVVSRKSTMDCIPICESDYSQHKYSWDMILVAWTRWVNPESSIPQLDISINQRFVSDKWFECTSIALLVMTLLLRLKSRTLDETIALNNFIAPFSVIWFQSKLIVRRMSPNSRMMYRSRAWIFDCNIPSIFNW